MTLVRSVVRMFTLAVRHVREFPRIAATLALLVLLMVLILASVWQFSSITQTAYERTSRERLSALLDGVAELAPLSPSSALESALARVLARNPSLLALEVWEGPAQHETRVATALRPTVASSWWEGSELPLALARSHPGTTFVSEGVGETQRLYLAVQAFERPKPGFVRGMATLAPADQELTEYLWRTTAIVVVLFLALFLILLRLVRTTDYALLYQRLRETEAIKDRFFAMASHELRAPVTAVRGYLDLLQASLTSVPEARTLAQRARIASDMLGQLVEDLLDVARLREGRLTFANQPVPLGPLLSEVRNIVLPLARDRGLALQVDDTNACVIADRMRLRQVLLNLLTNAIKYTHEGSVAVTVRPHKKGGVEIAVADTGVGMSSFELHNLFTPFYRASRPEVQQQPGTGLGLWIVRELVRRMGGSISVESIEGRGTTVRVILPSCPQ